VPASVLYMSMSLDGYIAGPDDEPGNPGGDGFGGLHEWYGDFFRACRGAARRSGGDRRGTGWPAVSDWDARRDLRERWGAGRPHTSGCSSDR